jgi:hypothetical protein
MSIFSDPFMIYIWILFGVMVFILIKELLMEE